MPTLGGARQVSASGLDLSFGGRVASNPVADVAPDRVTGPEERGPP